MGNERGCGETCTFSVRFPNHRDFEGPLDRATVQYAREFGSAVHPRCALLILRCYSTQQIDRVVVNEILHRL